MHHCLHFIAPSDPPKNSKSRQNSKLPKGRERGRGKRKEKEKAEGGNRNRKKGRETGRGRRRDRIRVGGRPSTPVKLQAWEQRCMQMIYGLICIPD